MNQTFASVPIGTTFLRLSDGHKFIKLPRYIASFKDQEYNAVNLDSLTIEEALEWFEPNDQVIPVKEEIPC